ncbi:MAG: CAP domain-containing protein [Lishizhenia sp.]
MKSSIFILICTANLCFSQPNKLIYYTELSYKKFTALKEINQVIDTSALDYALFTAALFHLTNQERKKYRTAPLQFLPALEQTAREHSQDMARLNFFSHTSKIARKKTVSDRMKLVNTDAYYFGENIASTYIFYGETYLELAEDLMKIWMNSSGHKKNILNRHYTHMGCGGFMTLDQEFLATQNFSSDPIK